MATVVRHNSTGNHFILLGTGYGAFRALRPNVIFGNLIPHGEEGEFTMAAVCNKQGQLLWCESSELPVVSVDGQSPNELLA